MSKLQDRINGLSPEEQELHKEIIEECLERERVIKMYSDITRNNIKKLEILEAKNEEMMETICDSLNNVNTELEKISKEQRERTKQLEELNKKIRDYRNKVLLENTPDENFYEA